MNVTEEQIEFDGRTYTVRFISRPFREGLEVALDLGNGEQIRISEQGLGREATFERLRVELSLRKNAETSS